MDERANRLKELKDELNLTYKSMNEILSKNNVTRKFVTTLDPEEYQKWTDLNTRSMSLVNEFIIILGELYN